MKSNGLNKSTIIWIVVIIIVVIGFIVFSILNQDKKTEYFLTKAKEEAESTLFNNYAEFKKFIDKRDIEDSLENKATYKKESLEAKFTEEYFNDKKLAVIAVYEDTSKDYIYSIDEVIYNKDKTEATIKYTYVIGTFADVLSQKWYNYMFVELENTVEHVTFEKDNSSLEK